MNFFRASIDGGTDYLKGKGNLPNNGSFTRHRASRLAPFFTSWLLPFIIFSFITFLMFLPVLFLDFTVDDLFILMVPSSVSIKDLLFSTETMRQFNFHYLIPVHGASLGLDWFFSGPDSRGYNFHCMLSFLLMTFSAYFFFRTAGLGTVISVFTVIFLMLSPPLFSASVLLSTRNYIEGLFFIFLAGTMLLKYFESNRLPAFLSMLLSLTLALFYKEIFVFATPLLLILPLIFSGKREAENFVTDRHPDGESSVRSGTACGNGRKSGAAGGSSVNSGARVKNRTEPGAGLEETYFTGSHKERKQTVTFSGQINFKKKYMLASLSSGAVLIFYFYLRYKVLGTFTGGYGIEKKGLLFLVEEFISRWPELSAAFLVGAGARGALLVAGTLGFHLLLGFLAYGVYRVFHFTGLLLFIVLFSLLLAPLSLVIPFWENFRVEMSEPLHSLFMSRLAVLPVAFLAVTGGIVAGHLFSEKARSKKNCEKTFGRKNKWLNVTGLMVKAAIVMLCFFLLPGTALAIKRAVSAKTELSGLVSFFRENFADPSISVLALPVEKFYGSLLKKAGLDIRMKYVPLVITEEEIRALDWRKFYMIDRAKNVIRARNEEEMKQMIASVCRLAGKKQELFEGQLEISWDEKGKIRIKKDPPWLEIYASGEIPAGPPEDWLPVDWYLNQGFLRRLKLKLKLRLVSGQPPYNFYESQLIDFDMRKPGKVVPGRAEK